MTVLASCQNICPGIKTPKIDELIILGSPLGPKPQADLSEKRINETEKVEEIIEKLCALWFFMLEKCFFNSSVVHLKRVLKSSRMTLAENVIHKLNAICETRQILPYGAYCSPL